MKETHEGHRVLISANSGTSGWLQPEIFSLCVRVCLHAGGPVACEGCACGQPYEERHFRWLVYLWDGGTLHDCIWACSEVRGMVVFVMLVLGTPHGCGMRACLCYQSMFCNSQSPWLGYEGMVVIPEHVLQLAVPMVVVWGHVYEVQALFTHHSRLTLCSHMFLVQPANVLPMHMHLPAWYEGMFMKFRLFSHRNPGDILSLWPMPCPYEPT